MGVPWLLHRVGGGREGGAGAMVVGGVDVCVASTHLNLIQTNRGELVSEGATETAPTNHA